MKLFKLVGRAYKTAIEVHCTLNPNFCRLLFVSPFRSIE